MLTSATQTAIHEITTQFWKQAINEEPLLSIASGKEIGHKIADHVDERTTGLLAENFSTAFQRKSNGEPKPRSMGDIWISENGMYNPINVKSGEIGKNGQPNMVAIGRLFPALAKRQIDSYYLLIVKIDLRGQSRDVHIYLVDILDYLEFTHLDTGPGQIMLRESAFYDFVDGGGVPQQRSLLSKVMQLHSMLIDADERLFDNRQKRQDEFETQLARFRARIDLGIDQEGLGIS